MSKLYTNRFRLNPQKTFEDVLDATRMWLIESPNNSYDYRLKYIIPNVTNLEIGNSQIICKKIEETRGTIVGLKYLQKLDNSDCFNTNIIFRKANYDNNPFFDASVSVDFTSNSPLRISKQKVKKPLIVSTLLNKIGPGLDGEFLETKEKPLYLTDNSYKSAEIVGNIIAGKSGNILPLIYVSKDFNENIFLDPEYLAEKLYGEAHVVVEPEYKFKFKLKDVTFGNNVYNGGIGIYWPNRTGKKIFLKKDIEDLSNLEVSDKIVENFNEIQKHYFLPDSLTWEGLMKKINSKNYMKFQERIEEFKKGDFLGKDLRDDYEVSLELLEEASGIIDDKDKIISDLENKLAIFESQIVDDNYTFEEKNKDLEGLSFNLGIKPLYKGEFQRKIIDCLAMTPLDNRSRVYDIVNNFIHINSQVGLKSKEEFWKKVNDAINSKNGKRDNQLKKLGFEVNVTKNHTKIYVEDMPQHKTPIAKTLGDNLCGLKNAFSSLKHKFD